MIDVHDVCFRYGRDGFELNIPELAVAGGEQMALVGPSGCGKTSLLYLLAGIHLPLTGSIRMGDVDVARLGDRERRRFRILSVGFVFQEFELLDYLTVRENILVPYRLNTALRLDASVRERMATLAASMGITDKLGRRPDCLSQGERQRAALCRALLTNPKYLLADEPTGNLDPSLKRVALELICRHARESNATLIVVTHDPSLLDAFDRVVDLTTLARKGVG